MIKSKKYLLILWLMCFTNAVAFGQKDIDKAIYFKSNSYAIDKKYYKTLNHIAELLGKDTSYFLKIFGFADKKGAKEYNDNLSANRANAVYDYLNAKVKIDKTKVYVTRIGESGKEISYDLHYPLAHIQQRCVDIFIKFYKKEKYKN